MESAGGAPSFTDGSSPWVVRSLFFLAFAVIINISCRTQTVENVPHKSDRVRPREEPLFEVTLRPRFDPARCFWNDGSEPRTATAAEAEARVARLGAVTDMPAQCNNLCKGGDACGDVAFWRVVRDGLKAVPFLIATIDDATPTAAKVSYMGGVYTKGDVALEALSEIVADLEVMSVVGIENPDCPACAWWEFVRGPPANRKLVKRRVAEWFDRHVTRLVWKNEDFLRTADCAEDCVHPAGGHYHVE